MFRVAFVTFNFGLFILLLEMIWHDTSCRMSATVIGMLMKSLP
jgi:hypothetical protein